MGGVKKPPMVNSPLRPSGNPENCGYRRNKNESKNIMKTIYQVWVEVTEQNITKKILMGETVRLSIASKTKNHYNSYKG